MFAIIFLLAFIICASMTGLTLESKAEGWWFWMALSVFYIISFILSIQS